MSLLRSDTQVVSLLQTLALRLLHLVNQHTKNCYSSFSINYIHTLHIVVVVPDTGGTRCMVECPQCLGLLDAWSSAPSVWDYNYFVVCCHPDPLLHPPDTTTPLLARYLLIKIWLPGNGLQISVHLYMHTLHISVHLSLHTLTAHLTCPHVHIMHTHLTPAQSVLLLTFSELRLKNCEDEQFEQWINDHPMERLLEMGV